MNPRNKITTISTKWYACKQKSLRTIIQDQTRISYRVIPPVPHHFSLSEELDSGLLEVWFSLKNSKFEPCSMKKIVEKCLSMLRETKSHLFGHLWGPNKAKQCLRYIHFPQENQDVYPYSMKNQVTCIEFQFIESTNKGRGLKRWESSIGSSKFNPSMLSSGNWFGSSFEVTSRQSFAKFLWLFACFVT